MRRQRSHSPKRAPYPSAKASLRARQIAHKLRHLEPVPVPLPPLTEMTLEAPPMRPIRRRLALTRPTALERQTRLGTGRSRELGARSGLLKGQGPTIQRSRCGIQPQRHKSGASPGYEVRPDSPSRLNPSMQDHHLAHGRIRHLSSKPPSQPAAFRVWGMARLRPLGNANQSRSRDRPRRA